LFLFIVVSWKEGKSGSCARLFAGKKLRPREDLSRQRATRASTTESTLSVKRHHVLFEYELQELPSRHDGFT